jgi:hypothetical protein
MIHGIRTMIIVGVFLVPSLATADDARAIKARTGSIIDSILRPRSDIANVTKRPSVEPARCLINDQYCFVNSDCCSTHCNYVCTAS